MCPKVFSKGHFLCIDFLFETQVSDVIKEEGHLYEWTKTEREIKELGFSLCLHLQLFSGAVLTLLIVQSSAINLDLISEGQVMQREFKQ